MQKKVVCCQKNSQCQTRVKNIPSFRPKWSKSMLIFRPKMLKKAQKPELQDLDFSGVWPTRLSNCKSPSNTKKLEVTLCDGCPQYYSPRTLNAGGVGQFLRRIINDLSVLLCGGAMASWLVRSTPDRAVRVQTLARDTVLCSWTRCFVLKLLHSTQEYTRYR